MRVCTNCGKSEAEASFYSRGSTCRACVCARVAAYRKTHIVTYRAYDQARRYTAAFREYQRQWIQQWKLRDPEAYRKCIQTANKKSYVSHPEWWAHRNIIRAAMRHGELVRPEKCPRCGSTERIVAHRNHTADPLDVTWLCHTCHMKQVREERVKNTEKSSQNQSSCV